VLGLARFRKLFSISHNGWLNFRQLPVAKQMNLISLDVAWAQALGDDQIGSWP
jgi:hypothetical protein